MFRCSRPHGLPLARSRFWSRQACGLRRLARGTFQAPISASVVRAYILAQSMTSCSLA